MNKNSANLEDFTYYQGKIRGDQIAFIFDSMELLPKNANNLIIAAHIKKILREFVKVE